MNLSKLKSIQIWMDCSQGEKIMTKLISDDIREE